MSITEISLLRLRDEATFNPMAILELLRQMVTTYGHVAGTTFKAYQEKEEYSKFYVIGGWSSIDSQKAFVASEMHRQLWQLLSTTLTMDSTELLTVDSVSVTSIAEPIVAVARHVLKSDVKNEVEVVQGTGGYTLEGHVYTSFTGMKTMPKVKKTLDDVAEPLKKLTLNLTILHIEVNQFI